MDQDAELPVMEKPKKHTHDHASPKTGASSAPSNKESMKHIKEGAEEMKTMWLTMKQRSLAQQSARGKTHDRRMKIADSSKRGRAEESAWMSTSSGHSGSSVGSSSNNSRTTGSSKETFTDSFRSGRSKATSASAKEHVLESAREDSFDSLEDVPDERDCGAPRHTPAIRHMVRVATGTSTPKRRGGSSSRAASPAISLPENLSSGSGRSHGHEVHGFGNSSGSSSGAPDSRRRSSGGARTSSVISLLQAARQEHEASTQIFDGSPQQLLSEYYTWRKNRGLPVGRVRPGAPHSY